MERHQVPLYLVAIAVGMIVGLGVPDAGPTLELLISPALAALLYVTFLQVPARALLTALRDGRFLLAVVVINFVVVPVVVAAMYHFLPVDQAIRVGVLLVLLCPCVDYVIVFSGLAGGDGRRLLSATPLLLLLQMVMLPVFLWAFMGADLADVVDAQPFLMAFLTLIVIPLAAAWLTQWWASAHRSGRRFSSGASALMVPLMMVVLAVVVACQIPAVRDGLGAVAEVIPFYVAFIVVMTLVGVGVGKWFGFGVPARRAVVFTGVTRNSLVVLPLALALPAGLESAAVVVVAQTLVEVIGMVVLVRVVPRLVPAPQPSA
ncbi:bile acid:sodium symporter [Gordonia sp. VNQ95]|jgi:ACR3 family arsenite efflux pump ArsB|uniref:arsenic resistance protein n=1 Tax=Gordonia TaxID=2053 RepID=UPI0032B4540D